MDNQRVYPRQPIQVQIELSFLTDSRKTVKTRDISEGGTYMIIDNPEHYPLGELVQLHFKHPLHDNEYTEKDAVIVRVGKDGIAAAFIEMDAF